jgi:hypothetical protein
LTGRRGRSLPVLIPSDSISRKTFYEELVKQCTVSRSDRFQVYQMLRNYYLFGSADSKGAPHNKIESTVDTLTSFIYSPDTVRFSLHLGTEASVDEVHKAVPLAKEVTEQWRTSKTHLTFGLGLTWACVFGVMLMKILWKGKRVRSYLVEPHQFGVLREDIVPLEDQEAFTHHYTITKTQLAANLEGNPRKEEILKRAGRGSDMPQMASGLSRLIIGSAVGNVPGSLALPGGTSAPQGGLATGPTYDYLPQMEVELVDMCDLYVWDDAQDDYMVWTRAAPDVSIFDRPSSWLGHVRGVPPFVPIRSEHQLYDYFWGSSFVAKLTWLQDWHSERVREVKSLLTKQVDPPMSITGGVGIAEEKLLALRQAGGRVSFPTPNAKVDVHAPEVPADVFAEISQIDRMFDDQAGLGHVLQGKGEPGVRSRGQADLMARLGSSRPKKRAIAAEESAEEAAGLILRLTQDHSEQRFQIKLGERDLTFTAEQFTRDYEVKVDAHSSSPIFVEDRKHDADRMLEARAIDRSTYLEMYDPPHVQELQERLKVIEKAELAAKQAELQAQQGGRRK